MQQLLNDLDPSISAESNIDITVDNSANSIGNKDRRRLYCLRVLTHQSYSRYTL